MNTARASSLPPRGFEGVGRGPSPSPPGQARDHRGQARGQRAQRPPAQPSLVVAEKVEQEPCATLAATIEAELNEQRAVPTRGKDEGREG